MGSREQSPMGTLLGTELPTAGMPRHCVNIDRICVSRAQTFVELASPWTTHTGDAEGGWKAHPALPSLRWDLS